MNKQMTSNHAAMSQHPDSAMNFPTHRRLYASAAAWLLSFSVAFGLTAQSVAIPQVAADFNVSLTTAILSFSIFLIGVAFAPVWTPHAAERVGRSILYLSCHFVFMLFILGASQSQNISSLLATRFFAGVFGGPVLVLLEGTYADLWSAATTNTYYSFLAMSSYIGAACGPLICGFILPSKGWRWASYTTLMISVAAYLVAIGMPETYQRELVRRRARRSGQAIMEAPAESGANPVQILRIAVVEPLIMLVTEPIVIMTSLYLMFNWGVLFQFFVSVPIVLNAVYGFDRQQSGLAFISAIIGTVFAGLTVIGIEQVFYITARLRNHGRPTSVRIENRLIPAMIGALVLPSSLFWIGWTAKPSVHFLVPIAGTGLYVYASLLILISFVSYLFDAYPAAGTLSALTAAAVSRIVTAAIIPLVIVQFVTKVSGKWALGIFGFIALALAWIPFAMFFFGERLRARSAFSARPSIHSGIAQSRYKEETGSQTTQEV